MSKREIRLRNMIAYGAGDIYGGGAFIIIGTYFMLFLTTNVGINPAMAGLIVSLGKIWDAVTDPMMGILSDKTRSRFGRRRVYFLLGIVPITLSFILLWLNPQISGESGRFLYYLLAYMFFNTVFTMVMVPYNALPAEMVSDYRSRSKMMGIRMLFSQGGTLVSAVVPGIIFSFTGRNDLGYFYFALIIGVFYATPWLFTYFGTWEREVTEEERSRQAKNLGDVFREFFSTFRNKSFRSHIAMYLSAYASMDIFMALLMYYLLFHLKYSGSESLVLGTVLIVQIIGVIIVSRSCIKKGNAPVYRRHIAICMSGLVLLSLLPEGVPFWAILAAGAVFALGMAGGVFVPYNNLAFVIDADTIINGRRREGIYSGMTTFIRKIAQALALQIVGIGLSLAGFARGAAEQSASTVSGIRFMFTVLPLALMLTGFILSRSFRIDPENHRLMLKEIESREKGEDCSGDAEVVRACELVTGCSYDTLWS
ncbi:MAG: MFS transporter [Spirochaetales bacterium]|nr:MFS transporter [Spirochaetales bacterium]